MENYHSDQRQNTAENDSRLTELSRRSVLSGIGLVGGIPRITTDNNQFVNQTQTEDDEAWPQFQYDNENTGHPENNTGVISDPSEQWAFKTGNTAASVAVADGTVYIGSADNNVYALETDDGTEQWSFQTGDFVLSSPAVVDDRVYFGSNDGKVYALSAKDGTEQWSKRLGGGVSCSPAVVDDTVYIASPDSDRNVYALSAEDGSEQWSVSISNAGFVDSAPAVVDGTVYIGSRDENVYALSAEDGSEQWSFDTGGHVESSPTVVGDTVYIGSNSNNVYALSATDGTEQWSFQTGSFIYSSPAVVNETIYIGSADNNVYALSTDDGTEQWSFQTGGRVESSPAVVDDIIYVGSEDGKIYALSADDGSQEWSFETGGGVATVPAVVDGSVYIGSHDDYLYALQGNKQSISGEGESKQTGDESGGIATFFSSPSKATGGAGILAGGLVSAGYLVKKWRDSDDDSQPTRNEPSQTEEELQSVESTTEDSFLADLTYADIDAGDTVSDDPEYELRAGEISPHDLSTWVITPGGTAGETIDTATTDDFVETVDQWANLDTHEYLTTVYGHGADPVPWVATEPADDEQLGDEFSIADRIDYLTQVCEAVHHVSRYGVVYENLTPESILVDQDGELQLRGVIDEFLAAETSAYQAPEKSVDSTHDGADVYRVGAVAYEILTGEQPTTAGNLADPSTVNPDLPGEVDSVILKAMAETPEERYETVLHLRDALSEV